MPPLAQVARALGIELADAEGKWIIHFLWDVRKFYDPIRISKLIPALMRLGYPSHILVLGVIAHKAPRLINVGPCTSEPIEGCFRSIIAGCQQSVSWTRGLVHKLVEGLGYILPGSVCYEHVDDLSQVIACKSKAQLLEVALEAGAMVEEGTKEADILLSEKSVITTNCNTGNIVAEVLRNKGIQIHVKGSADDLGIETSAGKRRNAETQNKNWKRAKESCKERQARQNQQQSQPPQHNRYTPTTIIWFRGPGRITFTKHTNEEKH